VSWVWSCVLEIDIDICFLVNVIDGILASRSSLATNAHNILKLLKPNQELIYMADRTGSYYNQELEGYYANKGGCKFFTTKAQVNLIENKSKVKVMGTIPHALIHQYDNRLDLLIKDYYEIFNQKPIILLDFENDVIKTLNEIKDVLHLCYGVRLDTSVALTDKSLENIENANGVSKELILLVKNWLLENGFNNIKICISSGLNYYKIKSFQDENLPIDMFGVGNSLLRKSVHISADLVKKNDIPFSKFGRKELNGKKLKRYI
ncbi:MAG: nicotinate phosphoribosyltransferase, partial [Ureaplasma sp.]|nr:nicotinate phosphoribosyltransferase [Ureaplasma sp.]